MGSLNGDRPMRRSTAGILIVFLGLVLQVGIAAQERISPTEASKYVGKPTIVCGQVASATFAARSRGRPTFLNLDRPYPTRYSQRSYGERTEASFLRHQRKPTAARKSVSRERFRATGGNHRSSSETPDRLLLNRKWLAVRFRIWLGQRFLFSLPLCCRSPTHHLSRGVRRHMRLSPTLRKPT